MRLHKGGLFFMIMLFLFFFGCKKSEEERYREHEKSELASGIKKDSLFLGLSFGMPQKEFREFCFDMNLKGKFKQGGQKSSVWVEAKIKGMQYPAILNFYPKFKDHKISEMDAAIYYDNPIYKDGVFDKDSLLQDVLGLMDTWYEGGFFKIKSPYFYKDDIYVKVKGNKRITVFLDQNEHIINLWYVDLATLKK